MIIFQTSDPIYPEGYASYMKPYTKELLIVFQKPFHGEFAYYDASGCEQAGIDLF